MIFVDSNVPMYLVGAPHPHKSDAQHLLERAIARGERLVTSAEVLQEILHRYVAIERREAIQPAFDVLLGVADEVFSVELEDIERAKRILDGLAAASARDAIHAAVMVRRRISRILTFDRAFDTIPGIDRVV
ncbi:MAG: type II toxin-antitoxin system VapC family toxin [Gemmatimonadota bacterium]